MAKNKKPIKHTKLLRHAHTGKLRSHKHTSYGGLALVLLLALIPVAFAGRIASADGSYQTYAVVPAVVPKNPPAITNPSDGQIFKSSDPVNVKGNCPGNSLVKVFKNEVMAGATICRGGTFQITTDLFVGNNSLVARAYNANDVPGPDSATVNVKLLPPGINLSKSDLLNATTAPAGQFYLTSDVIYKGVQAGDSLSWPLTVAGGQAPYAVSIGWGDGKTDLVSRGAPGQFTIAHTYAQAPKDGANYTVVIKATDQAGNTSYLQLVAIVSGNRASAGILSSVSGGGNAPELRIAGQLLAAAAIAVLGFWIGEKREIHILNRRPGRLA